MTKKYPKDEINKALEWADTYEEPHVKVLAAEVRDLRMQLSSLRAQMFFGTRD